MKNIRQSTFETNSSSSHSIVLKELNDDDILDIGSLTPDDSGAVYIETGEFGWETDRYTDSYTKASYLLTALLYSDMHVKEFNKVLFDVTNAKLVILNNAIYERNGIITYGSRQADEYNPNGYIDHQSHGGADDILSAGYDSIKNFIFNPKSVLYTGNDNDGEVFNLMESYGDYERNKDN